MKRLSLLFLGMAVMLGLSMTAFAQLDPQIVFTDVPGPQTTIQGPSGNLGAGIYTGTVGTTTTHFICDDDLNSIQQNDAWNANVYTLSNVATYGNGQYAVTPGLPTYGQAGFTLNGTSLYTASGDSISPTPTIQQDYNMAAYLANQILSGAVTNLAIVAAVQWAIWDIMDTPNANHIVEPGGAGCTTGTSCGGYWVNYAWTNDSGYTNSSIIFYTPTQGFTAGPDSISNPNGYAQEFISETPEPISMALMGTFLSLAGFGLGKRKLFSK